MLGEISTTSDMQMNTTLMAENEGELKNLLMRVKEVGEKTFLNSTFRKLRSWHQIPCFMANRRRGEWKQWQILFCWGPKLLQMVTAAVKLNCACFLGRKAMINLDGILRSKDITLPTKVCIVEGMFFQ